MTSTTVHIITGVVDLNRIEVSPGIPGFGKSQVVQIADVSKPELFGTPTSGVLHAVSRYLVGRQVVLMYEEAQVNEGTLTSRAWIQGHPIERFLPIGLHDQLYDVRLKWFC